MQDGPIESSILWVWDISFQAWKKEEWNKEEELFGSLPENKPQIKQLFGSGGVRFKVGLESPNS